MRIKQYGMNCTPAAPPRRSAGGAMSAVPISGGECPAVAVFRSALLHGNEPYILTQAEAVPRYRCFYVGTHRTDSGIALPPTARSRSAIATAPSTPGSTACSTLRTSAAPCAPR